MLFTANLKNKIASKNVVPLILPMVNVPGRSKFRRRSEFKNRTCSGAVLVRQLACGALRELLRGEWKTALTGFGDGGTPTWGLRSNQRSGRRNAERIKKVSAADVCHARTIRSPSREMQQLSRELGQVYFVRPSSSVFSIRTVAAGYMIRIVPLCGIKALSKHWVHRGNSVIRRETRFHISVRNPDKMHVRGAITPAVRGELARHIEKSR